MTHEAREPRGYPIDEVIGENMRERRKAEHLSQQRLADYLTIITDSPWDQPTVSLAERGKRPFRVTDLIAIARIFNVSMIRLLVPHTPTHPDDHVVVGRMALQHGHIWYHLVVGSAGDPWHTAWPEPLGDIDERIDALTEYYSKDT